MARFTIETTPEEQATVLKVLEEVQGQTIPVSKLAELTGLSASRVRYAIMDLLEAKKIERVASKAINKHYVRYSYNVL